ncbi:MAG TPA: cytochrome c [Gemmatimonadaceae bacterium]
MRLRAMLLPALIAVPAGSMLYGGWAVVTVENPPERLVVGVPYTLEYSVRQHGIELLNGLRGSVEATTKERALRADAKAVTSKGRYRATLTFPAAGSWTITVHSGFGPSRTTMLPITVTAAGAPVVAMTDSERGEHLFAAKGCMTCHVEMKVIPVDVRTNRYDEKFVKQLLADPKSMPKRHAAGVEMPNLGLKATEIAALAAYLAGPNSTGTR